MSENNFFDQIGSNDSSEPIDFLGQSTPNKDKSVLNNDTSSEFLHQQDELRLLDHIDKCRADMLAYEQVKLKNIMEDAMIECANKDAKCLLSNAMVNLKKLQMFNQIANDNMTIVVEDTVSLSSHHQPYGYPNATEFVSQDLVSKNFSILSKKMKVINIELSNAVDMISQLEVNLTLARRKYEEIIDGLIKRVSSIKP